MFRLNEWELQDVCGLKGKREVSDAVRTRQSQVQNIHKEDQDWCPEDENGNSLCMEKGHFAIIPDLITHGVDAERGAVSRTGGRKMRIFPSISFLCRM